MADNNDGAGRKVTVTNHDRGPRFVHANGAPLVVPTGEALPATMNKFEIKAARSMTIGDTDAAMFTIEGDTGDDDDAQPKPLASRPVAELRQLAEAEGVALTGRKDADDKPLPDLTKAKDIADAIEAHRAANPA